MENVLLVISLLACIALIVAVLLQRSEGGALGMGGGGGGGLMSGRGAADTLVHATMVLAAIFFVTCLALTRIAADKSADSSDVIRTIETEGLDAVTDSPLIESLESGMSEMEAGVESVETETLEVVDDNITESNGESAPAANDDQ